MAPAAGGGAAGKTAHGWIRLLEAGPSRQPTTIPRPSLYPTPLPLPRPDHDPVTRECGYPASSIRERVYAGSAGYGILLYTATSDAEGTLGGLVETGRQIARYLRSALELAELCSNDPVCAHHIPNNTHEHRFLHGAACHGCLLIAETSCEQYNDFLDRALVVQTLEGQGAEFFKL
ncbi:MAG: DUF1998 domain-containing protein [Candidatus Latescibacteria bacterium]|nr:DUF1998 domain-containing protein [Candidatus Latescibacterota bacterium]